jgi:hypothetical protein
MPVELDDEPAVPEVVPEPALVLVEPGPMPLVDVSTVHPATKAPKTTAEARNLSMSPFMPSSLESDATKPQGIPNSSAGPPYFRTVVPCYSARAFGPACEFTVAEWRAPF